MGAQGVAMGHHEGLHGSHGPEAYVCFCVVLHLVIQKGGRKVEIHWPGPPRRAPCRNFVQKPCPDVPFPNEMVGRRPRAGVGGYLGVLEPR